MRSWVRFPPRQNCFSASALLLILLLAKYTRGLQILGLKAQGLASPIKKAQSGLKHIKRFISKKLGLKSGSGKIQQAWAWACEARGKLYRVGIARAQHSEARALKK